MKVGFQRSSIDKGERERESEMMAVKLVVELSVSVSGRER